jgi:hypothetical protein
MQSPQIRIGRDLHQNQLFDCLFFKFGRPIGQVIHIAIHGTALTCIQDWLHRHTMRSVSMAPYTNATAPVSMRSAEINPLKTPTGQCRGVGSGLVEVITNGRDFRPHAEERALSISGIRSSAEVTASTLLQCSRFSEVTHLTAAMFRGALWFAGSDLRLPQPFRRACNGGW